MRRGRTPVTPERESEVEEFLSHVREWAARRTVLAGSWAKGEPGMESDVDLIVLTPEKESYLRDDSWMNELGGVDMIRTQDWGPLYTERRLVLPSGLEIEFGVAPPSWAATNPPDPNVREEAGAGGLRALYDPEDILRRFIEACR